MRLVLAAVLLLVAAGCTGMTSHDETAPAPSPTPGASSPPSSPPTSSPPASTPTGSPATTSPPSTQGVDHVIDGLFFDAEVDTEISGANLVVTVTSLPDHDSVYWPMTDPRYEAYNGPNANFRKNPNTIRENTVTFRIPMHPTPATTIQSTPGGPIGVAVNGVPFFNQYAAMNQPLTNEIDSFDQYNGHPQQQGQYHYHVEPTHMTSELGRDALLGFLLDGYPVYGPVEDGKTLVSADLDAQHGHTHDTADFGELYHYHFTADAPYLNGNGFHGVPGTRQ